MITSVSHFENFSLKYEADVSKPTRICSVNAQWRESAFDFFIIKQNSTVLILFNLVNEIKMQSIVILFVIITYWYSPFSCLLEPSCLHLVLEYWDYQMEEAVVKKCLLSVGRFCYRQLQHYYQNYQTL